MSWSWLIPPGASTFVDRIDWIYYLILAITGIAFVVVEAMLIWCIVKYRRRPNQKAQYYHGSAKLEVAWTAVTAAVVLVIGIISATAWTGIKGRNSAPPDAMRIGILAKQFEWHVTYPGPDGQLGTADDDSVRNQLHLPVNRAVNATLTAEDAIHSFFIPAFRIKQDAVPGMAIQVWFQPTQTGEFEIACAELCGLGHYRMKARATVHTDEDFARWLQERRKVASR